MGFYHTPSPAEYLSAFHLFDYCVCGALSAVWKFVVPLNCRVCFLWVGLDYWLVKVSWLGELVSVFWCVELNLFCLACNEVSSSEFWSFYGFSMTFGSPFLIILFYWRIIVVCVFHWILLALG